MTEQQHNPLPTLDTARVFVSVFRVIAENNYDQLLHHPGDMQPSTLREQLDECIASTFDALAMNEPPVEEMEPWHRLVDDTFPAIAKALEDTTDQDDDDIERCGECGDAIDHDRLCDGQCLDCALAAIPADFPVQPLLAIHDCETAATCEACGLSWDDSIATAYTPAPAGRCPFEAFHRC
jgi:hypothetical protein